MRCCLTGIFAVAACVAVAASDADALSHVRRAIERDARTTYTSIRVLSTWESPEPVRVRRDQSSSGMSRVLVIAPMAQQGLTTVDNGEQWVTYNPDRGHLTIQDSPQTHVTPAETSRRYELLRRNYKITRIGTGEVAGRPTIRVRLQPQSGGPLFTRSYWIDTEKSVLLRVEWTAPGGQSKVVSDTISISYPRSLPEGTFDVRFRSVGTPREIRIQAPLRHSCLCALDKAVSFDTVNPFQMPHGFLFTGADAIRAGNRTMAALRYTDGASNVTIYQACGRNNADAPWRSSSSRPSGKVGSVWVSVDGDLPPEGKRAILNSVTASTSARESQALRRVAADHRIAERVVRELRDTGLGFEEVIAIVVASRGDEQRAISASRTLLSGKSLADLARETRVSEASMRDAIRRFRSAR